MQPFITKLADKIQGSLSCFDRILFRGYLPFFSGAAMAAFLDRRGVRRPQLKGFLLRQAARLKEHARIAQGLVCVFSTPELCRTYSIRWDHASYIQPARRKCPSLDDSLMDPEFGLIHVRI